MKFSEYAKYLQKLEDTTKRLEITDILVDLIKNLEQKEIKPALYLALGELKAPFETERFNIADKMMIRAISEAFNTKSEEIENEYGKSGDLGLVVATLADKNKTTGSEITQTYNSLLEIAKLEGSGSQEQKVTKTATLLKDTDSTSAKFITRMVLGTTRLGFTELTIVDALSLLVAGDKSAKKQIEQVYKGHPDIGLIAETIVEKGLSGLKKIKPEVGVPILPQKAQRLPSMKEIIEKMGQVWGEYKFDGTRVQLHMDRGKTIKPNKLEQEGLFGATEERIFIKTFTRNLEETTYQYPDIVEAAKKQIDAKSVVFDGEAIGYDKETGEFLPFQQTIQRKRKHDVKETAAKIPLKYFVFDILYLDGEPLAELPLTERKKLLKKVVKKGETIVVDDHADINNLAELKKYFEQAREKGLEGLILKKPDAPYEAGARNFTWVKLKVADTKLLDDTVDVVVLGYYFGKGARAQFGIGGFLAGIYDEESGTFKSITKVGTGLKDDDWHYLKKEADNLAVKNQPKGIDMNKIYNPDVWVRPDLVVELGADEISKSSTHTAGYALRFPRLLKFRDDKRADDCTTLKEIVDLHNMQKRGYHKNK